MYNNAFGYLRNVHFNFMEIMLNGIIHQRFYFSRNVLYSTELALHNMSLVPVTFGNFF